MKQVVTVEGKRVVKVGRLELIIQAVGMAGILIAFAYPVFGVIGACSLTAGVCAGVALCHKTFKIK